MTNFRYSNLIEELKGRKCKLILPTLALSTTLVLSGCGSMATENANVSNEDDIVTNEQTMEEDNIFNDVYEKSKDADTAVERSITGTIELASSIANATDEYKETKEYKQDVERLKDEFDTLVNWLLGKTEIDGYTIKDVGSKTVSLAKDAVSSIDGVIESYIPDYKDKAKKKLSELGDFAWDKATDGGAWLLNKGEEFANEVKEKRKQL